MYNSRSVEGCSHHSLITRCATQASCVLEKASCANNLLYPIFCRRHGCTGNQIRDWQIQQSKGTRLHLFSWLLKSSLKFARKIWVRACSWSFFMLNISLGKHPAENWNGLLPHAKKRNLPSDVDLQLFKKATRLDDGAYFFK